jgi:hypothetical protein
MEANPEVMPVAAVAPTTRHTMTPPTRTSRPDPASARSAAAPPVPKSDPRLSEDPMRRTDRYRLVMPWSARM